VGSTMYFHHHVVIEQRYDIGDDLYLVQYDSNGGYGNHSIGIEDKNGSLTMLGDWCFVLPADEPEEETSAFGIILSIKEEPELEGVLLAIPEDSEYEMELLDGSKVYRMRATELVYVKEA
jgi:hypothetical protein